jgi:hypothetical protein
MIDEWPEMQISNENISINAEKHPDILTNLLIKKGFSYLMSILKKFNDSFRHLMTDSLLRHHRDISDVRYEIFVCLH